MNSNNNNQFSARLFSVYKTFLHQMDAKKKMPALEQYDAEVFYGYLEKDHPESMSDEQLLERCTPVFNTICRYATLWNGRVLNGIITTDDAHKRIDGSFKAKGKAPEYAFLLKISVSDPSRLVIVVNDNQFLLSNLLSEKDVLRQLMSSQYSYYIPRHSEPSFVGFRIVEKIETIKSDVNEITGKSTTIMKKFLRTTMLPHSIFLLMGVQQKFDH
jgi:hypothetical protein